MEKLDTIDARTTAVDERTSRIEQSIHRQGTLLDSGLRRVDEQCVTLAQHVDEIRRQGTLLDSGLRRVDEQCVTLAQHVDEHRQAVDEVLTAKLAPPPTPTWREWLNDVPDEQRAAAAAAVVLAVLLARRQSRRAMHGLARRVPLNALLLPQLASVAVLLTSQAADSVHALPLVGRVLGPPRSLERPRRVAQCCFRPTTPFAKGRRRRPLSAYAPFRLQRSSRSSYPETEGPAASNVSMWHLV